MEKVVRNPQKIEENYTAGLKVLHRGVKKESHRCDLIVLLSY